MSIKLNTKSVYYKTPTKFVPIGKYDYSKYNHQSMGIEGAEPGQTIGVGSVSGGKPTSFIAKPYFYNMEIRVLNNANQIIDGVGARVHYNDISEPVYYEAIQSNGEPIELAIPTGFVYYVELYDPDNICTTIPTPLTGIITDHDETLILRADSELILRTAQDIKNALDKDIDLSDYVGESITCSYGDSTLTWDIVDYKPYEPGAIPHLAEVTLMMHDVLDPLLPFEPEQALMWCENGLVAGNYTFIWDNTRVYFTLTAAIPAGGQLRATNSAFSTYESQNATSTLETGTVSTTEISDATDLGVTGSGLLNHHTRVWNGSNNFAESSLFWWLNSDAPAGVLRTPVTKFSRAHSYAIAGFLYNLDPDFLTCLSTTDWKCSTNNVYECPASLGGVTPGKQSSYTVKAKISLASEMEIFGSYDGAADGSTIFDLYNDATDDDRKKYKGTAAQNWWLRSPYWSYASFERGVGSSGGASGGTAGYSVGVVPVCKITETRIL